MMHSIKHIAIYGAGGFGRHVAWLLSDYEKSGLYDVICHIEDGAEDGKIVNGKHVSSWERFVADSKGNEMIAVAVADPPSRRKIVKKCSEYGFASATLQHQSVLTSDLVNFGEGSIICGGSILTVNIDIGPYVHINLGCTIGHDVRIGAFSTLSPGVNVSGNVHIGESVFVGTGVSIINGTSDRPLVIADRTVIGAGACVTGSTEADCLYAGVPAELKKRYR